MWDQILVYVIVAAAAAYLARGFFRARKKAGCGGCERCPDETPQEGAPPSDLVQIEIPSREKHP